MNTIIRTLPVIGSTIILGGLIWLLYRITTAPPPPPVPYTATCYSSDGIIYEGITIDQPRGNAKYGFRWTDTDSNEVRIAADCIFIKIVTE